MLGGIATWTLETAQAVGVMRPGAGVDPDRQIAAMLSSPLSTLRLIAVDSAVHAPRYLAQFVGQLGWRPSRRSAPTRSKASRAATSSPSGWRG